MLEKEYSCVAGQKLHRERKKGTIIADLEMQEAALRKRQERLTTRKESFLERCSPRVSPSSLKS